MHHAVEFVLLVFAAGWAAIYVNWPPKFRPPTKVEFATPKIVR